MNKYIDAEKLKRSIEAQCRVLRAIGIDELAEMTDVLSAGFIQEIENAPTEDVVEVVRCKECKYADLFYPYCTIWEAAIDGDGYCYKGEKE